MRCVCYLSFTDENSYDRPPVLDITLEEFETCAIERLRVLAHIESLSHRSLPYPQLVAGIASYAKQHLPLSSNSAHSADKVSERRRDEIGHWVLRLAFCRRQVELTTSSGLYELTMQSGPSSAFPTHRIGAFQESFRIRRCR